MIIVCCNQASQPLLITTPNILCILLNHEWRREDKNTRALNSKDSPFYFDKWRHKPGRSQSFSTKLIQNIQSGLKKKFKSSLWKRIRRDSFTDCRTELGTTFTVWYKKLNRISLQLTWYNPKIIESQCCKSNRKIKEY